MDENTFQQILKTQWSVLPQDIRSLISSDDLEKKVEWAGRKYNLTSEQISSLQNETLVVLMGLVHLMDFSANVERELGLPKEQARLVAQEIGTQVFADVKSSLREISKALEIAEPNEAGEMVSTTRVAEPAPENQPTPPQQNTDTTRDLLIKEIEQPSMINTGQSTGGTIVDEKLSKIVQIPRQEARVQVTETLKTPAPNNQPTTPTYKGSDPYREPIE